jgi:hypothetical protein
MDLAIYIYMLCNTGKIDLKIAKVFKISRGKHEFVFEDPNDVISKLQLEFANDRTAAGLMAAQRQLKIIMRERARERPDRR